MKDDYFNKKQEELHIKRLSLKELIKHKKVLGNYVEVIMRDFLRNNLPKKYSVATGTLLNENGSSPECDVIIYDSMHSVPLFQSGDIVVIDPINVLAIIEVKSGINTKSINKIKKDAKEIRALEIDRVRFKHIFLIGFESGLNVKNLRQRISPDIDDIFLITKRRKVKGKVEYEIVKGEIQRLIKKLSYI